MARKNRTSIIAFLGVILVPAALFWTLYRHGFLSVIDALAVGILAAAGLLFGLRFFLRKKIISLVR